MESRKFGYARVSSNGQNLDRQIFELKKYVPGDFIVTDKARGKDLNRPGYQSLKGALGLRYGDILYVKSLDRLSRNKKQINEELRWFKENGIRLIVLDLPTTMIEVPEGQDWIIDMVNNILIEVLSSIAEEERRTIKRRQREGIEAAKLKGKHLGRPAVKYPDQWQSCYMKWKQGEITAKEAMTQMQLKRTSFYKLVKEYEP